MNNWKPMIQTLMQQFAEFDNEGYDIKAVELAKQFVKNFEKYAAGVNQETLDAAPKL